MAAVDVTTGFPKTHSIGDLTMFIWRLTDVDDAETLTTGLGTNIVDYWVSWTGNPATQTSGGGHSSLAASTGIITFYPGEDNLGATVFVLATAV